MKLVKKKITKKQREILVYLLSATNCHAGIVCSWHITHDIKQLIEELLKK